MLKLRAAPLADSLSKRCGRVLKLSGRRRIKLLALSGLLLMSSLAFASLDTSNMTCAQVQDYVKTHGQTLLTTGIESGNYSGRKRSSIGRPILRLIPSARVRRPLQGGGCRRSEDLSGSKLGRPLPARSAPEGRLRKDRSPPFADMPMQACKRQPSPLAPYPPFSAPTSACASAESHLAPPSTVPTSHPFLSMTNVTGNPSALPSLRRVSKTSPLGSE